MFGSFFLLGRGVLADQIDQEQILRLMPLDLLGDDFRLLLREEKGTRTFSGFLPRIQPLLSRQKVRIPNGTVGRDD